MIRTTPVPAKFDPRVEGTTRLTPRIAELRRRKPITLSEMLEWDRDRMGVTMKTVAARGGVALTAVNHVLSGRVRNPKIETLVGILKGLGRDLAWLQKMMKWDLDRSSQDRTKD